MSRRHACTLFLLLGTSLFAAQTKPSGSAAQKKGTVSAAAKADASKPGAVEPPAKTIYDFSLPAANGTALPLSTYKGQTVLIVTSHVNPATNDQLAALAKLQTEFAAKKFVVLGVPSTTLARASPAPMPWSRSSMPTRSLASR